MLNESKDGRLRRQLSSYGKIIFCRCSFYPATPTSGECIQLPLARCQLHCTLKGGGGEERERERQRERERERERERGDHCHFLLLALGSRSVDCARKNRQLWDLSVRI